MLLTVTFVFVIANTLREKITTVGDSAPDFTIKADNGQTVSAAELWRQAAGAEFLGHLVPALRRGNALAEPVRGANGAFRRGGAGHQRRQGRKSYREFLARHRPAFLTARDPQAKINADYGTFKYPETYVISSSGKVLRKFISDQPWDSEKMVSDIKSLL